MKGTAVLMNATIEGLHALKLPAMATGLIGVFRHRCGSRQWSEQGFYQVGQR